MIYTYITKKDHKIKADIQKLKNAYLAIASHKMLSPLTIIKWNFELMKNDVDCAAKFSDNFVMVEENIARLERYSDVLLGVSDREENIIEKTENTVDFCKIINKVVSVYSELIAQNNLDIKIVCKKGELNNFSVNYNSKYIEEVVESVIHNAIIYSDEKTTIKIDAKMSKKGVSLSVSNVGIGIPKEDKNLIGESFYRASNAMKSENKGYGLSLYLSRLIMDNVSGELSFSSVENDTTEFLVIFPIGNTNG